MRRLLLFFRLTIGLEVAPLLRCRLHRLHFISVANLLTVALWLFNLVSRLNQLQVFRNIDLLFNYVHLKRY
jgi:hypothetical protein